MVSWTMTGPYAQPARTARHLHLHSRWQRTMLCCWLLVISHVRIHIIINTADWR